MTDLRSSYPTTIDDLKTLPIYQDMSIEDKRMISRYQVLVEKNNLTSNEQVELASVIDRLKDKMINSEDWNKVVGAIINLETYFKDNVIDEIDGKLSGLDEIANNTVNTVENAKNKAISEMNTAKSETIDSVNQIKTSATTEIKNTKDNAISEVSIIRNDAVQSIETNLNQANDVFTEMNKIEEEFKTSLPILNDSIERIEQADGIIKKLQNASNSVQDDIAKIEATGNKEVIIQSSEWVLNGDIYEKEITHTCNSENLHVTAKNSDTKEAVTIGYKILDKTRILLKSDEAINMSVILSASYYHALIATDVDEGEIVRARKGETGLDVKITKIDEQLETKALQSDLEVERNRIDLLTKIENGETEGNTELLDIRIGANGKEYNNAGENVRDIARGKGIVDKGITPWKTSFIECTREIGVNKFNKDDETIKLGKYLSVLNTEISDERCFISHKISCNAGDIIRITDDSTTATNAGIIYDKNGNMLYKVNDYISRSGGVRSILLPDDENISYVLLSGVKSNLESIMCTINEILPSVYTPYSYVDTFNLSSEINIENDNPLYGKTIITNGDSIMRGYGNNNVGFIDIIAERNNMKCINYAVSGATLAINTYASDGITPRHWIVNDIDNMSPIADYVILDGGFNDHNNNVPTGEMTNSYDDEFDKTTLLGALESTCQQLIEKYPEAKKGFVFPHGLLTYNAYWNTTKIGLMKKVLEKWGIQYLDLSEYCPPLGRIESLRIAYTMNGDEVHANGKGYLTFYCDPTEAWLKTL